MDRHRSNLRTFTGFLGLCSLVAWGAEDSENASSVTDRDAVQDVCELAPDLPGCGSERAPPGFAKFTAGRADALRWVRQGWLQNFAMIEQRCGRSSGG